MPVPFDRSNYDNDNIFAKILRDEIPCDKIFENDHALAFRDIDPKAAVHVLVIPKGSYIDFVDFTEKASDEELRGFYSALSETIEFCTLTEQGFRLVTKSGPHGGQEVPHYHVHVLGGEKLEPMTF